MAKSKTMGQVKQDLSQQTLPEEPKQEEKIQEVEKPEEQIKQRKARSELQGLIYITGLPGSGKSVALMTFERPEHVVMIDIDKKSESRASKLGIPYFAPSGAGLDDPMAFDQQKIVDWLRSSIYEAGKIAKEQGRDVLIIDNGVPIEEAFGYLVKQDPQKYGVNPKHALSGAYGGVNPGIGKLWESTIAWAQGVGFKHILLSMHVSASWVGDAPVEKYKGKGNKALHILANLSFILIRSSQPNHPPMAMIGKEALSPIELDENGDFHVNMALPPLIPEFTWTNLYTVMDKMLSGEKTTFEPDEIPSNQLQARYGPWLTSEQKELILAVAKNPNFRASEEEPGGAELLQPTTQPQTQPAKPVGPKNYDDLKVWAAPLGWNEKQIRTALFNEFGSYVQERTGEYFDWLKTAKKPSDEEIEKAETLIAKRRQPAESK